MTETLVREPRLTIRSDAARRRFAFDGAFGGTFLFDRTSRTLDLPPEVSARKDPEATHFWEAMVLPRLWSEGDQLVLHAAVVEAPLGKLAIVAPSGRGKSTLAVGLAQQGWTLLGDDVCAVSDDGRLQDVVHSLRLFPDSYTAFLGDRPAEPISPSDRKLTPTALPPAQPPTTSDRLRAIFLLEPPSEDLRLDPAAPGEACMGLLRNSFCLDPTDAMAAARRLTMASTIAAEVPVFHLSYPRRYDAIADVRVAIEDALGAEDPASLARSIA